MSQADGERERDREVLTGQQPANRQTDLGSRQRSSQLRPPGPSSYNETNRPPRIWQSHHHFLWTGRREITVPPTLNEPIQRMHVLFKHHLQTGFSGSALTTTQKTQRKEDKNEYGVLKKFKKIQNRLFLGRISKTESWKALSWILCGSTVGLYKTQTPESNTYFLILIQRRLDSAFPINTPRKV